MSENEIKYRIIGVAVVFILAVAGFVFIRLRNHWRELKEAKRVIDSVVSVDAVVMNNNDPFGTSFPPVGQSDNKKVLTNVQKAAVVVGVVAVLGIIFLMLQRHKRNR